MVGVDVVRQVGCGEGETEAGRFSVTDREGFEPSIRFWAYTRFPGVPLKPLEHLSQWRENLNGRRARCDGLSGYGANGLWVC